MIRVFDPSTEEQIAEFTDCGPDAVNEAVARAKASAESGIWSGKPDYERAKILWRVAELIDKNAELLAELEMLNGGMYPAQAEMQVKIGAEWFRYYAGWCTKIDGIARDVNTGGLTGVDSHMHTYTLREPYGVVGLIFPWNGPVFNFCAKLAPSLAAGCNSVVKPAEETPLSALVLMQILAEAGVPDGVANLVNGYGHTVGAAITAHPDVEKVAFTGSTEVGRAIVHAAADSNLNKVTLELGGKSPVLIFDDASLKKALDAGGVRRLRPLRAGLCLRVAHLRAAQCLRAGRRGHGDDCERHEDGRPEGRGHHERSADQPEAARTASWAISTRASPTAPRSSPAGTGWIARGTSSTPPSSPILTPTRAGSSRRRSSGPSSRSCRSTTKTKPSRWPTTAPTAWPRRCGPRTLAAPIDWPSGSRPEP